MNWRSWTPTAGPQHSSWWISKCTEYPEPNEDEAEPEPTVVEYIHLTINRRWDDNTTAEPVALDIEDENAVALFDWMTRDEQPALAAN